MDYTKRLNELLHPMTEPSDERYRCYNTGGVEVETGEFLYSLVRLIKPKNILETGTHHGISAAYMAGALKDNYEQGGNGKITTIEFAQENYDIAHKLFSNLGLSLYIVQEMKDSTTFEAEGEFDLIFLDTEPQIRFAELVKYYKHLKPGGYVLIHDLHQHMNQVENEEHGFGWPYGVLPSKIQDMVDTKKLIPFHFRTPRGLTAFYKPGPDDYFYKA